MIGQSPSRDRVPTLHREHCVSLPRAIESFKEPCTFIRRETKSFIRHSQTQSSRRVSQDRRSINPPCGEYFIALSIKFFTMSCQRRASARAVNPYFVSTFKWCFPENCTRCSSSFTAHRLFTYVDSRSGRLGPVVNTRCACKSRSIRSFSRSRSTDIVTSISVFFSAGSSRSAERIQIHAEGRDRSLQFMRRRREKDRLPMLGVDLFAKCAEHVEHAQQYQQTKERTL